MIKKPEQMDFSTKNFVMILYGLPGVGKTTLACSAPDVLLIDTDNGIVRVKPEHRRDTSYCARYEDLLTDLSEAGSNYKTIVIDTCGALIDMLKDWAMRNEPSASKKGGGFSLQGYGVVKSEFLRLMAELRTKYNVILVLHASKERNGDDVFYDTICEGAAKNLIWMPCDVGGFVHIVNGERYIGFSPTEAYNAKSSYGIKGLVKVPELADGERNDFLTRLFGQMRQNLAKESAELAPQKAAYDAAMKAGYDLLDNMGVPDDAVPTLTAIRGLKHSLTSLKELEDAFKERVKLNGWKYDKGVKAYVAG